MRNRKSTDQELRDFVSKMGQRLAYLDDHVEPQEFAVILIGIMASIVGNMSQSYWREFSRVEPCGLPGCDCHLVMRPKVMQALQVLRDDYMKYERARYKRAQTRNNKFV